MRALEQVLFSFASLSLALAGCAGDDPAPGPAPDEAPTVVADPDTLAAVEALPAPAIPMVIQPDGTTPPIRGSVPSESSRLGKDEAGASGNSGGISGHLHYFGGPLMQNVKVYQLLWGEPGPGRTFMSEVTGGQAAAVYRSYVEGPWLDWIDSEYSTSLYHIGRGSFGGTVTLSLLRPASRGAEVYDSDVQAELGAQIAAGTLPNDSNALFMISFPAEVSVLQSLSAYGRGVGKIPDDCGEREKDAGLCYPLCRDGYNGVGPVCWQMCPEGFHDDGLTCRKPGDIISSDNSKCPWYDICGLTFAAGCSVCPAGYHNDGCTCRIDPDIFWKSSYGRGVGAIPDCAAGSEKDAGLCYPGCAGGFDGVGPVCWGHDRFCGGHSGFCGFHSRFLHGFTDIRYAVLADMGPTAPCHLDCWTGDPFSDLTKTFSHELVEAITDPVVGIGWTDLSNGEIGDICNSVPIAVPDPSGAYIIQSEWSNQSGTCRY